MPLKAHASSAVGAKNRFVTRWSGCGGVPGPGLPVAGCLVGVLSAWCESPVIQPSYERYSSHDWYRCLCAIGTGVMRD